VNKTNKDLQKFAQVWNKQLQHIKHADQCGNMHICVSTGKSNAAK